MSGGNYGRIKTRKKSEYWSRHGKHSTALYKLRDLARQQLRRIAEPMYATVREAFDAAKKAR